MRLLTVLLMFSLISCSTTKHYEPIDPVVPYNYIDPKLDPILKMFAYEAEQRGVFLNTEWLSMSFGNIKPTPDSKVVGYCQPHTSGRMVIKIHGPSWYFMDDYEQEVLVFHELGHCLLQRHAHCDNETMQGEISILNTYVLNPKYYKEHREELLDELFNPSPECIQLGDCADEVDSKVCRPKNDRQGKPGSPYPWDKILH